MPKKTRARITDAMQMDIVHAALAYPRRSRAEVAHALARQFGARSPKLIVLERKISYYRKNKDGPLEAPWSLASLGEYPIPSQNLAIVLAAAKWSLEHMHEMLSIRHAKWVSQLADIASVIESQVFTGSWSDIGKIVWAASLYCYQELLCEVLKRPFDTRTLDHYFFGLNPPHNEKSEPKYPVSVGSDWVASPTRTARAVLLGSIGPLTQRRQRKGGNS